MIDSRAVYAKAASLLLRYPSADVLTAVPAIRDALAEVPGPAADALSRVADHYAATSGQRLAEDYVATFDFRRRCALHLTYYTHGDTRERGAALVRVAEAYRAVGYAVGDGELPDYLPAVLDLAATCGEVGWRLLRDHRVGLDLLAAGLERDGSVWVHAVAAVLSLVPPPSRRDREAAAALAASGPPAERVGLAGYPSPPPPRHVGVGGDPAARPAAGTGGPR